MAELSAIKLPNNTTFTFKDVEARGTTELIVGTQTAATGAWTGNASFSTLEDGRSILYWLPYAGSGNATLNLTLSNNTTTGAINCYYGGTSRLTTHYGAGNVIRLTYRENVSIAGSSTLYTGWWAEGNYDTNSISTSEIYVSVKTGAVGIWNVSLVMRDGNGTYQNICTAANGTATTDNRTTDTTKKANTNGFEVYSPIWYCASSYNANTNISGYAILYDNQGLFDARYSFNVTRAANQLVTYKPVFLVGTIHDNDGLFYLDPTWWTQTATDTSKVYILVGGCYDSNANNIRINLNLENTWYKYDGTRLVPMQNLSGGGESQTVTLTGDVTGTGSTGGSIVTALASSGVTAGSYGPSANATPAAGSSFNVPYVTVDAKGRVTAASTKSVTMPTNASTVNGHSVNKDVPSNAVFTDTTALGSMTGTLGVSHGGTGQTTLTSGSYLIGNGTSGITSKTSSEVFSEMALQIYPVGSVYLTFASTNPGTLFGGSWVKLNDSFLLSSGSNYPVSEITVSEQLPGMPYIDNITNTGGEATHTLTVDEMPSHSHTVPRGGNAWGTKVHGYTSTRDLFTSTDSRMSSEGGGQAHNNMPPYITVHMWYRYA